MEARRGLGLLLFAVTFALPAHAQTHSPGYTPPKTPWGAPDLQGVWSNASVTDMQREPGFETLVLTPDEAARMEQADFFTTSTREEQNPVISPFDQRKLDGADLKSGGNYNAFWVDQGSKVASVKGTLRSSWIVEPGDGRIPYRSPPEPPPGGEGEGGASSRTLPLSGFVLTRSPANGQQLTVAGPALPDPHHAGRPDSYDNPETRPPSERCLVGFGSAGGPVMTNVIYNNRYQIVQTAHACDDPGGDGARCADHSGVCDGGRGASEPQAESDDALARRLGRLV